MLAPLAAEPSLIDRTYRRLLAAIEDGTLAPGTRIRQAALAAELGISRQPVSHALHLLHRQGLVEDAGQKGMQVVPLDPVRVQQLYQVRAVVDGLAARLAAEQMTQGSADPVVVASLQALADADHPPETSVPAMVRADADFHRGLAALSGNSAIEEMTAPLWPHLMRSMAFILDTQAYRAAVWTEHKAILAHVLAGEAGAAERAARAHADRAAARTARRLRTGAEARLGEEHSTRAAFSPTHDREDVSC